MSCREPFIVLYKNRWCWGIMSHLGHQMVSYFKIWHWHYFFFDLNRKPANAHMSMRKIALKQHLLRPWLYFTLWKIKTRKNAIVTLHTSVQMMRSGPCFGLMSVTVILSSRKISFFWAPVLIFSWKWWKYTRLKIYSSFKSKEICWEVK